MQTEVKAGAVPVNHNRTGFEAGSRINAGATSVAPVCCLVLGLAGQSQAADFTSFEVPWGEVRQKILMNANGVIAGSYAAPLPCPCEHGFVRAANGTFTSFDAPDAFYTVVESMNTSGAIAGFYGSVQESDRAAV